VDWLKNLVTQGGIADVILAVVAIEALALAVLRRRLKQGISYASLVFGLLPGALLVLALGAALTDSAWYWVALWLAAAGLAHAADLGIRLRGR